MKGKLLPWLLMLSVAGVIGMIHSSALAQAWPIPTVKIGMGEAKDPGEVSVLIQILILLTVLSLAPAILVMMTSFTRLIVVLSFLRHALGTNQMHSNQLLIGLALFLTFFIMTPVWQTINEKALTPYKEKKISQAQAL